MLSSFNDSSTFIGHDVFASFHGHGALNFQLNDSRLMVKIEVAEKEFVIRPDRRFTDDRQEARRHAHRTVGV